MFLVYFVVWVFAFVDGVFGFLRFGLFGFDLLVLSFWFGFSIVWGFTVLFGVCVATFVLVVLLVIDLTRGMACRWLV